MISLRPTVIFRSVEVDHDAGVLCGDLPCLGPMALYDEPAALVPSDPAELSTELSVQEHRISPDPPVDREDDSSSPTLPRGNQEVLRGRSDERRVAPDHEERLRFGGDCGEEARPQ